MGANKRDPKRATRESDSDNVGMKEVPREVLKRGTSKQHARI